MSPRPSSSARRSGTPAGSSSTGRQRLQRVLAAAGYGSRRSCEALITDGRVEVDGEIVVALGTQVDPEKSKIFVDGIRLRRQPLAYFLLNKPVGVVTTNHDPQGRPRVVDLIPAESRVFPVGRLDRSSEGLILLTNDGELAQQLTHPRYGVRKIYQVTVAGQVTRETMKKMQEGIFIAEGRVRVEGARIRKARSRATDLEITLREGKNREIRASSPASVIKFNGCAGSPSARSVWARCRWGPTAR
jgi:23S rRNA pseudouridine2605 synthase